MIARRLVAGGAALVLCGWATACRDGSRHGEGAGSEDRGSLAAPARPGALDASPQSGASGPAVAPANRSAIDQLAAPVAPVAPRRLALGERIVDHLAGKEARVFLLDLEAGQAAALTVEGLEVNVRLIVDGPGDRNRYFVEDVSRAIPVVEHYVVVARDSGTFRLTVQAMMPPGRGGQLAVRAEVRAATRRDRLAAELEELTYRMRRDGDRDPQVVVAGDPSVDKPIKPAEIVERARPPIALAHRLGDRMREARLIGYQAEMRRVDERFDEAAGLWRAALRVSLTVGDRAGEGTALGQLGWLALANGDIATDLRLVRQALACCREIKNLSCVAHNLNELGDIQHRLGDPEQALTLYREAAAIWGELANGFQQSMVLVQAAMAYAAAGDEERALAAVDEAESVWKQDPADSVAETGYRALVRGTIHLGPGRDPESALGYFERALALGRESRTSYTVVGSLSSLSSVHRELGHPERALAFAREALDLAQGSGMATELETARVAMARALYALGDLAQARALLTSVAARYRGQNADLLEAHVRTELARTQRAQGDRPGALASIRTAVARAESARARIHADALRATYLSSARDSYDLYIEVLLDSGLPADAELALAVAEQARARTLRETLTAARVRSPALADPALAGELGRAREEVRLQEVAHEMLLERGPSPAQVAGSRREIARRVQAYQEIDARIRARDPGFARLLAPPALDVAALRASLADDETLLAYNLGDGASTLWLVSRAGVEVVRLPGRAILEEQIRQTQVLLTARATAPAGESAEVRSVRIRRADAALPGALDALGHLLLGAARERLGGGRLLIVADGGVAYVPFAALPGADGRPLLASHELAYVPAASLLVGAPDAASAPVAGRVAIVADPVFSSDDPRISTSTRAHAARAAELRGSSFGRLTWSGVEAERIAALAPGATVATGFDATEARVRADDFARADIVHFATHSALDVDAPELSAIVLSLVDEGGRPRDGLLRLHEIVELHLDASLVVLSACETALGRRVRGEGLVGLVRGFLYAGADQVLASLWRVHDQGTAELMARFYGHLLGGGHDAAGALRAAQLELRAEPRWSAPYYWASFGIQGVPRPPRPPR